MQITHLSWVMTHTIYKFASFQTPKTLGKSQCPNWMRLLGISTINPHLKKKKSVIRINYMASPKPQKVSGDGTEIR